MIKIICVGKIKEKFYNAAIDEYLKRISKYTKLSIIEVIDSSYDDINKIKEIEKDRIMCQLDRKDYIITLEIEGKQLTSTELSEMIDKQFISYSNITFIIGGSYGLHNDIKKISNYSLSFSKLTFPHQLFRIILLEQIYRSYKIMNNQSYHK